MLPVASCAVCSAPVSRVIFRKSETDTGENHACLFESRTESRSSCPRLLAAAFRSNRHHARRRCGRPAVLQRAGAGAIICRFRAGFPRRGANQCQRKPAGTVCRGLRGNPRHRAKGRAISLRGDLRISENYGRCGGPQARLRSAICRFQRAAPPGGAGIYIAHQAFRNGKPGIRGG